MPIVIHDRAALAPAVLEGIVRQVSDHASLERVLEWSGSQRPPRRVEQIVTQDEYTHDVLVPFDVGLYLAYDVS